MDLLEISYIEITDLNGRVIYEEQLDSSGKLNFDQLAQGMYILKINHDNRIHTEKIIVK